MSVLGLLHAASGGKPSAMSDEDAITVAIVRLTAARGAGKSICPSEAARDVAPQAWRALMPAVRKAAIALASEGRIAILRKGKPVDPENFKGVYRLAVAAPSHAD